MKNNNIEVYAFYSKFLGVLVITILIAMVGAKKSEEQYIKPLSKIEQQAIISQVSIKGYNKMIKLNCYSSVVVRIRTNRWNDQYCANNYQHLNFFKIIDGEI